jgi:dTDP-4-amino-4,6-dideoxygalactose transaminase
MRAAVCTDLWAAVGTRADFAAFSFYPTKNLVAFGDGGALAANRPQTVERARHRRFYGWDQKRQAVPFGVNSRLDELQAEVVRVLRPLLR